MSNLDAALHDCLQSSPTTSTPEKVQLDGSRVRKCLAGEFALGGKSVIGSLTKDTGG